jgi:hypothetical protein
MNNLHPRCHPDRSFVRSPPHQVLQTGAHVARRLHHHPASDDVSDENHPQMVQDSHLIAGTLAESVL